MFCTSKPHASCQENKAIMNHLRTDPFGIIRLCTALWIRLYNSHTFEEAKSAFVYEKANRRLTEGLPASLEPQRVLVVARVPRGLHVCKGVESAIVCHTSLFLSTTPRGSSAGSLGSMIILRLPERPQINRMKTASDSIRGA